MKKGKKHGANNQDHSFSDYIAGDINDFFSDQNFGDIDIIPLREDGNEYLNMVYEDDLESPSGFNIELNNIENTIVRLAQKSLRARGTAGARKNQKAKYITADDYDEGPQRDAFLLIYGFAELLFADENNENRDKAIEFFFCRSKTELNFVDAAAAIDQRIRVDVIRLRIQYEFWIREDHLSPLPLMADILPSIAELYAAQHGGLIGIDLAREAWFEPGIELDKLINKVIRRNKNISKKEVRLQLDNLLLNHVMSQSVKSPNPQFYTTGKNPILRQEELIAERHGNLSSIYHQHWSNMF